MKWIKKISKEPPCLTELRSTPNASYSSMYDDCKALIRHQLLNEQGHLCAYCMKRISEEKNPDQDKISVEIEHFKAQAGNKAQALYYKNMLAVCNGFAKQKTIDKKWHEKESKVSHCDKTEDGKGDGAQNLRVLDPRDRRCEQMIKYSITGKIEADADNLDVTHDLEKMLNLNVTSLVNARKEILDKAASRLKKAKNKLHKDIDKPLPKTIFDAEIEYWTELQTQVDPKDNKKKYVRHRPFCQVAVWYLKKKMK